MLNQRIVKLVTLGKTQGRAAAEKIVDEAFDALYNDIGSPGKPMSDEQQAAIKTTIEGIAGSAYEKLRPPAHLNIDDTECALFLEARRTEFLKHFMDRVKAKWAALVIS